MSTQIASTHRPSGSSLTLSACAVCVAALAMTAQSAEPQASDAKLIASAESAAPANVGKNATIVTMDADGKMHTLRKGTNNFTCMPDNPATPGPDPMCMDPAAMDWVHAYSTHGLSLIHI